MDSRDGPPGRRPAAEKIILERVLRFAEARAKPGDSCEIGGDDCEIDRTHGLGAIVATGSHGWLRKLD